MRSYASRRLDGPHTCGARPFEGEAQIYAVSAGSASSTFSVATPENRFAHYKDNQGRDADDRPDAAPLRSRSSSMTAYPCLGPSAMTASSRRSRCPFSACPLIPRISTPRYVVVVARMALKVVTKPAVTGAKA
jgi:hypothetical protein